jgi:hypothetical protein
MQEKITRTNVPTQHMLDLLLLEPALDDQSRRAVHGPGRTHLGEHELDDVLRLPVHPFTDVADVREDRLLVALTSERGRSDRVPFAARVEQGGVGGV